MVTQSTNAGINFAALPYPCGGNSSLACASNSADGTSEIFTLLAGFTQINLVGAPGVHVVEGGGLTRARSLNGLQLETKYTGCITYSQFNDISVSGLPPLLWSSESLTNADYGYAGVQALFGTGCSYAPGQEANCATFDSMFGASVSAGLMNVTDPDGPPNGDPPNPLLFIVVGEPGNTTLASGTAGGAAHFYFTPMSVNAYQNWSYSGTPEDFLPNQASGSWYQLNASSIWGAENGGQGVHDAFEFGSSIATTYNIQMAMMVDPRVTTTADAAYISSFAGLVR